MVCTLGRGKMAAMVRLLTIGTYPENSSEEVTHENIALQTIQRQFCDAYEANLLEEKDMHVFDCRPLTDPLYLVCCNACKKPIKGSQYAAHAERCSSINSIENTTREGDGSNGHKKPPRKGRKKSQANNGKREQEKSECMSGNKAAVPDSNLDGQNGMHSVLPGDVQRKEISVDHATVIDAARLRPEGSNCSADVPVPLATKIYHSQGSNRLRIALGRLYREASAKEDDNNSLCVGQDKTMLSSQAPYLSKSLHGTHKDNVPRTKKEAYSLVACSNRDQKLSQSSALILGTTGGVMSANAFPNQFQENGCLRPGLSGTTTSVGMMKNSYNSASYSYSSNSDTVLGKMQQPSGSVPVG